MNRRHGAIATATLCALPALAFAQQDCCPGKCCPSTIVVPFAPGGSTDIVARLLATGLQQVWGSTVVVENVSGAGGLIGAVRVASATADGKTLLLTNESLSTNAALFPQQGRSTLEGLTAIAQVTSIPYVLVVPAQSSYRSLQELISDVRANPGKATMASTGNGSTSHIAGAMFSAAAKINATHMPYKGAGPAIADLVSGQVSFGVFDIVSVQSDLSSGKLRPLAVTGSGGNSTIRGVPSFAQSGLDTLTLDSWIGLFAPKGLGAATVQRVASELNSVLQLPSVKASLLRRGFDSSPLAAAEFSAKIQRDFQVRNATISTLRISRD